MNDVQMLSAHACSVRTPMHGAPGPTTAQSMLCMHTPSSTCGKLHCTLHVQKLSWGGASRAASSTEGEPPRGWPDSLEVSTGPHSSFCFSSCPYL